jgi:hypothetical protein
LHRRLHKNEATMSKVFGAYCFGKGEKEGQGVQKNVTKTLTVDMYEATLFGNKTIRKEQFLIRSQKHQIHTIKQNKVALNEQKEQTESKRFIRGDKITTLDFGH